MAIAWLNIIAAANADSPNKVIGISDILNLHYQKYGRSFFSRYDYEEVPSSGAKALFSQLDVALTTGSLLGTVHASSSGTSFTVSDVYSFEYKDPIDGSVSKNQGHVITFSDGSRVVFRLSGTGSQGATVRLYVERYVAADAGPSELGRNTAEGLQSLIEVALEITQLRKHLGRDEPTVITVSVLATSSERLIVYFVFAVMLSKSKECNGEIETTSRCTILRLDRMELPANLNEDDLLVHLEILL
jgi:phosphoglucomutase